MVKGSPWVPVDLRYSPNRRFTPPDSRFPPPDSRYRTGHTNDSSDVRAITATRAEDALTNPEDIWSEIHAILDISRQCVYYAFQLIYEDTTKELDIKRYLMLRHISWDLLGNILHVIHACIPYVSKHAPAIHSEGPFEHWFDLLKAFIAHIEKNTAHLELGQKLKKNFLSVPSVREAA